MRYAWPGNVRELINVVERAVLLTDEEEIGLDDLPDDLTRSLPEAAAKRRSWRRSLTPQEPAPFAHLEDLPPCAATSSWRTSSGGTSMPCSARLAGEDRRGGPKRAGITPRSLYDKMKKLGLSKESYRERPRGQPAE